MDWTKYCSADRAHAWPPEESLIAFQTNPDGSWMICLMCSEGSKSTDLSKDPPDEQISYWQLVILNTD
jgi:hypothetical protein